mmetsp:Transcript_25695/g.52378  ORF Transcript_25695/g.52378 Transcript_25695/m.52378 type:complete len:157 (-) Transcript_25695:280-750(-)|eukprot:CAMPEP_0181299780 /NCGR_PEP_ID=MMETSP1101-20121128/6534_1 /TAXON_ID=46948 /ORGANISM="Rhodomonas abbreviata, Strain Caron Lab Isolate" /LENGTH=156 /DNA_ID=CAMNT_0023404963 /DNA_START=151 /DNA_END=621 /DNA_ORIENTATION=-
MPEHIVGNLRISWNIICKGCKIEIERNTKHPNKCHKDILDLLLEKVNDDDLAGKLALNALFWLLLFLIHLFDNGKNFDIGLFGLLILGGWILGIILIYLNLFLNILFIILNALFKIFYYLFKPILCCYCEMKRGNSKDCCDHCTRRANEEEAEKDQ